MDVDDDPLYKIYTLRAYMNLNVMMKHMYL